MRHEKAFLGDIAQHPEDDAPRLVFADWLEEHGREARAEFIRAQCALARMDDGDERRPDLEARQAQLLPAHRKGWAGPLRHWARRWEFRRGFVEGVTLPAEVFLLHAQELFRLAPVRAVHLVDVVGHEGELASCPHLARLTGLALTDPRFGAGQRRSD